MEQFIHNSLAAGIIRPSSSSVGAGFIFVSKTDHSLHPCIGLNAITVKNKSFLPLIFSAFEPLRGATILTELDLRNAYHLVRIWDGDEWKTTFKCKFLTEVHVRLQPSGGSPHLTHLPIYSLYLVQ